jgi:putative transposase
MKKNYTESQLVRAIKEHGLAVSGGKKCRLKPISKKISEGSKNSYFGIEIEEINRLEVVLNENYRLKEDLSNALSEVEYMKNKIKKRQNRY